MSSLPDQQPELPSIRRAWLILFAVSLTSFQTALSLSVMFIAFAELEEAFTDASKAELSWVINSFSIVGAASLVLAGALGERLGRRRVILWGTAGFVFASVVGALSPNVSVLILARVAQALSSVLSLPAGAATLLAAFPKRLRGTAIGTWSAAGGVAAAMGPLLGGILISWGGWQAAFWINVPMGLVAFVVAWLVVPEYRVSKDDVAVPGVSAPGVAVPDVAAPGVATPDVAPATNPVASPTSVRLPDPLGSLILAIGISAIVFALVQTEEWRWLDARVILVAVTGVILLGILLRRSARHPNPILDLRLFAWRSYSAGNVAMTLLAFGFFAFQFSGVQLLTEVWDYGVRDAGLLSTPIFAFTALGSSVAGRLTDRFGASRVAIPGGMLWLVGVGWLALNISESASLGLWLFGVSIGGVGSGLMWGAVFAGVVSDLPEHFIALGTSVTQTLMRVGSTMGVAVAVTVIAASSNPDSYSVAFGISAICCAIAMLFLISPRKAPTQQANPVKSKPSKELAQ